MGTRSTISIRELDGTTITAYCHWDGYFSGVGADLIKEFGTEEKARKLLEKNSYSSVVSSKSGRAEPHKEARVPKPYVSFDIAMEYEMQEYNYVFDVKEQKWFYYEENKKRFYPLEMLTVHGNEQDKAEQAMEHYDLTQSRKEKLAAL